MALTALWSPHPPPPSTQCQKGGDQDTHFRLTSLSFHPNILPFPSIHLVNMKTSSGRYSHCPRVSSVFSCCPLEVVDLTKTSFPALPRSSSMTTIHLTTARTAALFKFSRPWHFPGYEGRVGRCQSEFNVTSTGIHTSPTCCQWCTDWLLELPAAKLTTAAVFQYCCRYLFHIRWELFCYYCVYFGISGWSRQFYMINKILALYIHIII